LLASLLLDSKHLLLLDVLDPLLPVGRMAEGALLPLALLATSSSPLAAPRVTSSTQRLLEAHLLVVVEVDLVLDVKVNHLALALLGSLPRPLAPVALLLVLPHLRSKVLKV